MELTIIRANVSSHVKAILPNRHSSSYQDYTAVFFKMCKIEGNTLRAFAEPVTYVSKVRMCTLQESFICVYKVFPAFSVKLQGLTCWERKVVNAMMSLGKTIEAIKQSIHEYF